MSIGSVTPCSLLTPETVWGVNKSPETETVAVLVCPSSPFLCQHAKSATCDKHSHLFGLTRRAWCPGNSWCLSIIGHTAWVTNNTSTGPMRQIKACHPGMEDPMPTSYTVTVSLAHQLTQQRIWEWWWTVYCKSWQVFYLVAGYLTAPREAILLRHTAEHHLQSWSPHPSRCCTRESCPCDAGTLCVSFGAHHQRTFQMILPRWWETQQLPLNVLVQFIDVSYIDLFIIFVLSLWRWNYFVP